MFNTTIGTVEVINMKTKPLFGDFFKEKRIQKGFTLRGFCKAHGLDPGNISKLERGMLPPPSRKKSWKNTPQISDSEGERTIGSSSSILPLPAKGSSPANSWITRSLSEVCPSFFGRSGIKKYPNNRSMIS